MKQTNLHSNLNNIAEFYKKYGLSIHSWRSLKLYPKGNAKYSSSNNSTKIDTEIEKAPPWLFNEEGETITAPNTVQIEEYDDCFGCNVSEDTGSVKRADRTKNIKVGQNDFNAHHPHLHMDV